MPAAEHHKLRVNCIMHYLMGLGTETIALLNDVNKRNVQRYIKKRKETGTWFSK